MPCLYLIIVIINNYDIMILQLWIIGIICHGKYLTISLFSNVLTKTLNDELNENWHKISNWKCELTSTLKKNARRNYFRKSFHPVTFNYTEVITFPSWKWLERILDEWLSFTECIDSEVSKCDKLIEIIKKLFSKDLQIFLSDLD